MTGPIGELYSKDRVIKRLTKKLEELEEWAKQRYEAEVTYRPVENIHRETLRITWQQIIDKLKE